MAIVDSGNRVLTKLMLFLRRHWPCFWEQSDLRRDVGPSVAAHARNRHPDGVGASPPQVMGMVLAKD